MIKLDSTVSAAPQGALLISTQCHENYAWREDGTLDELWPHWKAKGGSDYLLAGVDEDATELEQAMLVDRVRDQIEIDNAAYREAIIGWRIVPAGWDPAEGEDDPQLVRWLRGRIEKVTLPEV